MDNNLVETTESLVREARTLLPDNRRSRVVDLDQLMTMVRRNDDAVTGLLRPALRAALPGSGWEDNEHATGPMMPGDQWVLDPVGGNLNLVHGLPEWNIGVTLVRDGNPLFTVLYAPEVDEMFTATAGGGAFLNGTRLTVSEKTDLGAALSSTGQATATHSSALAERFGRSITAMMQSALHVRSSVPVGHQLTQVAAGRMDVHWQFENVRSHIGPVLLVQEAGGIVTDFDGGPWSLTSAGYVAAAPGVHPAALDVLRTTL